MTRCLTTDAESSQNRLKRIGEYRVEHTETKKGLHEIMDELQNDMRERAERHRQTLAKFHDLEQRIEKLREVAETDPNAELALRQLSAAVFAAVPRFEALRKVLERRLEEDMQEQTRTSHQRDSIISRLKV